MDDLTQRVIRLEVRNRYLSAAVIMAGILFAMLLVRFVPQAKADSDAKEIRLASADGKRVAYLRPEGLVLADDKGIRAIFTIQADDAATLVLFARAGTTDVTGMGSQLSTLANKQGFNPSQGSKVREAHVLLVAASRFEGCYGDYGYVEATGANVAGTYKCGDVTRNVSADNPTRVWMGAQDGNALFQVQKVIGNRMDYSGLWAESLRLKGEDPFAKASRASSPPSPPVTQQNTPHSPADNRQATMSQCGLGCPQGYHPTMYRNDSSCGGGQQNNRTECSIDAGPFLFTCGTTCPTGYHVTGLRYTQSCGSGGNNNSADCAL